MQFVVLQVYKYQNHFQTSTQTMSLNNDQQQLPPKDEFQDGSDCDLNPNTNPPNNPNPIALPQQRTITKQDKRRLVEWNYVWVETPNICDRMPKLFVRKWVRTVKVLQKEGENEKEERAGEISEKEEEEEEEEEEDENGNGKEGKMFKCKVCVKSFGSENHYEIHRKVKHSE